MPAMLEDPTAPVIYRTSGAPPYPTPDNPQIPPTIVPRQVTLRDRITIATLIPFSHPSHVPPTLLNYLCSQLNLEIEKGDTYPMMVPMPLSSFGPYWFANFGAVMLLGDIESIDDVVRMEQRRTNWEKTCLGSFYIKPNYPGRSSHVCNGGFLVTDAARNRGVGRLMGEGYLEWAPKLGYTYSVFNLVYETNVASCRIWDALGFKRIGRVKSCGNLRSHPDELVDAIMYGRDLGPEGEDFVSEERFDKIRFYLKHGKYPNGADRAEKSRLRSAATHYKLLPPERGNPDGEERLMLKDKEVVSDPQRQYEIARQKHAEQHGGINKTTAAIAEMYHWVRIKETVSMAIKNCPECKDATKIPTVRPVDGNGLSPSPGDTLEGARPQRRGGAQSQHQNHGNISQDPNALIERLVNFDNHDDNSYSTHPHSNDLSQHNIYQSPGNMQDFATQLHGQLHQELHGYSSPTHDLPLDPQIINHNHEQHYTPYDPHPHSQSQQDHHHHHPHQHTAHDQLITEVSSPLPYQHTHNHSHSHSHNQNLDPSNDAHYDLDMSDLHHGTAHQQLQPHHHHGGIIDLQDEELEHAARGGDDTRLATARHVTCHDRPMAFVHEGHEGQGRGRRDGDGNGDGGGQEEEGGEGSLFGD